MASSTVRTESAHAERSKRARRAEQAEHSGRMEGQHVDGLTREDVQEYVEGRISSNELRARVRARYGIG